MNLSKNQKLIIGILGLILISILGYFIMDKNSTTSKIYISNNIIEEKNEEEIKKEIIVHIAGCVQNEGIVKIKEGSRVYEAIDEAGGLLENADIKNINLAYIVTDGQKIYIPSIEEQEAKHEETIYEEEKSKININTAEKTELQKLPRNRRNNREV